MKINEYYALKKGDLVEWQDTGSKCLVLHFDKTDYPNNGLETLQEPNSYENLCVIFCDDAYRIIGHRKEFKYINHHTRPKKSE